MEILSLDDFKPSPFEKDREKKSKTSRDFRLAKLQAELRESGLQDLVEIVPMIFTIARRYYGTYKDESLQDEMVQELYLALYRIKDNFDASKGSFRRYCSRFLGQESKVVFRKYKRYLRRIDLSQDIEVLEVETAESKDLDRQTKLNRLEEALQCLNAFEQWVIRKVYLEGYSYEALRKEWNSCQTSGTGKSSITPFYTRACKALKKLQVLLKDLKGDL